WQSYGKEPVAMPLSWMGHFDAQTGISYTPWGRVLGREALLLHSPWHVPPGKVWVDYQVALPQVTPIALSFGIAMGPDVATPDKSDGVTFSGYLVADGQERELMRKHHDKGEWLDYTFDLSPFAGKTVTVRLQAEPGPKNNASFDYSFFGDARITVGGTKVDRAELVKRLTTTRAYQATARASAASLSNSPKNGVTPSNVLPYKNSIEQAGNAWRFVYAGDDCHVVYTYEPLTGTLDDFTVQVDDGRPFQPASGGGATVTLKQGDKTEQLAARGGKAAKVTQDKGALNVQWEYDIKGTTVTVAWTFNIIGKALAVSAKCESPVVSAFSLGDVGGAPLRKTFVVPYLVGHVNYLPVQNVYVCRYLDWTVSHSSMCPQGAATYDTKTDGARNTLLESGYVAVSPDVDEVLPNIPHPPSPYLELLGPRVMLDVWGHYKGTYKGDAENLRALKDNGVDHLALISHDWQRYGYDVKLPDHLPANPQYGGDEGMAAFGKTANECGYVWSLHENYIDLYPDAPSYDATARVLNADGSPSKAWFNEGTNVQSFGLKCNRALGYAKQNAPEIHKRFGTNAGYLDVHTCVPPWHQLDHEANQPMAGMALAKVKYDTELFQFMRDTHGGPLFGEGCNHFYWAGRCDGVEAQVNGGEDHAPFLDFDLLKIHPQMTNHGMGYYERWFRKGYSHEWGRDSGTMEQIDKYRAQELAYGHAGFIGNAQTANIQWVAREHNLMHPVQRLYGTTKAVEVRYEVDGQLVSASVALAAGDTSRQYIRYESGLTLWVNWRAEPWRVEGRVLPQWGFLALGRETEVSTALRDGKFADYAECPEYLFADARTSFNMPYIHARKDIEPRLRSFKHLGGDRAEVTYEWVVNDTLDEDYHCFVHGNSPSGVKPERIEFQQDHPLPKPTSQWRKGETIVDGPYELRIAGTQGSYDLTIGLYKGARVPLKGVSASADRILLARLKVERQGGTITNITSEAPAKAAAEGREADADFSARLNPAGTWIDFGKVATDGSAKIVREKDRLIVFPYPRDKRFRVSLDLKALAPTADAGRVQVRALAAGTQQDIGAADFKVEDGRLVLTAGMAGAGRYVVTWK
ncbi:MAG: DUF5696 domain-containing protein, partial [Planctomycetota bacterium]|nr:DUF5696 domain-containing protein [Planctomycetota bacterium]